MSRKLSVLLVEDEERTCQEFVECVEELDDVVLVGVTNNSAKALEYVHDFVPDAIILDLELHQGGGNGLLMLKELRNMALDVQPYVLITTHNSSAITYESARMFGADFIMSKHQSDYSCSNAVEFLRVMKPVIHSRSGESVAADATTETQAERTKRISRRICAELDHVGISPKVIGYRYLTCAIQTVIKRPTPNLCSVLADQYGKTEASVERAMQNAINKAWRTTPIEDLLQHYTARISSDRGVPTLTEFVYFYANKIRNKY